VLSAPETKDGRAGGAKATVAKESESPDISDDDAEL